MLTKTNINAASSLCLLLVCAAAAFAAPSKPESKSKAPLWVTSPHEAYPDGEWLCALATGADFTAAENAALAALAQAFRVDVQSITRAQQDVANKTQSVNGRESSETQILSNLSLQLTASTTVSGLIGVERDVWADKRGGAVYAIARMSRKDGAARYRALIAENETLIGNLTASASKASGTFEGYADLRLAASLAELTDNFYTIFNILNVLEPAPARAAYGNANNIRKALRESAAAITVRVSVSGDVDGRITKAFESVFSARGFKTGGAAAKSYTLKADFKLEDAPFADSKYQYTRYVLTASLADSGGAKLVSFSENDREGHTMQREARERSIRAAEKVITESGFAAAFDDALNSM